MNDGLSWANIFIRSARNPPGVSRYVGGISDTKLKETDPDPMADKTNLAFVVGLTSAAVHSVSEYFFHVPSTSQVVALANSVPSSPTKAAVTGLAKPPALL